MEPVEAARTLLREAIEARVFPAAAAEVGTSSAVLWREPFGSLIFEADAAAAEASTIFDLASLTKPIATSSVGMDLLARNVVSLTDPIAAFFPEWRGPDREPVTVQDLLEHTSGLSARLISATPESRREFEHEICTMPLEYASRARSIYSDLGFILLGFLLADRGGDSLAAQFASILARVMRATAEMRGDDGLTFGVPPDRRARVAPTVPLDEDTRRGRLLRGEVHDNYAAALGGIAGHSGLFGSVGAVGAFARAVLRAARGDDRVPSPFTPALVVRATTRSSVPDSSRALGWDTMRPTSSCGTQLSPAAFGHVGFTGTSLWIDPGLNRYFVLLANRACGGGTSEQMQSIRRAFHDALATL